MGLLKGTSIYFRFGDFSSRFFPFSGPLGHLSIWVPDSLIGPGRASPTPWKNFALMTLCL